MYFAEWEISQKKYLPKIFSPVMFYILGLKKIIKRFYWKLFYFISNKFSKLSGKRVEETKTEIAWFHIIDHNNVGDQLCCPIDYSGLPGNRYNLIEPIPNLESKAIIFGGGGLFYGENLTEKIGEIAFRAKKKNRNTKLIIWGAGLNYHGEKSFKYPSYLKSFDLVGIRDYGNPFNYVPCPSCLNPIFNKKTEEPSHDYVIFEHFAHPILGIPEAPKMSNWAGRDQFSKVISHLSSGSTVITNSYHGIYWSLLLGRKVLIYKPFSNRFLGFFPKIEVCDEKTWDEKMRISKKYPNYFEECKKINNEFLSKLKALLSD